MLNSLMTSFRYSTQLQHDIYNTCKVFTMEVSKSHADSDNEGNHNALVEDAAAVFFNILEIQRRSFNISLHL